MKKLLAILGSASLVTTAGIAVVACSKDTGVNPIDPPTGGKDEINKLIKELETEVSNKWATEVTSPMADSATLLDVEAESNNLSFLEKENLQDVYKRATSVATRDEEQLPVTFYEILEESERATFENNIEALLSPSAKMNNLKKSISASTYQVILAPLGGNWMGDIVFDYDNALLNQTETEGSFLANIELEYSMKYSYMDAEDTKQSKTVEGSVSITISDDQVIVDTIQKIQDQFDGDLFKSANDLVWIDQKTLGINATEIVGGKTEKYNVALEEYYKTLAKEMTSKIQTEYFAKSDSPILKAVTTSLENENDVIRNKAKVSQIGALDLEGIRLTSISSDIIESDGVIFPEELARQKLYFGAVGETASIELGDGSVATDEILYKDLQSPFETKQAEYASTLKLHYNEVVKYSTEVEEAANIQNLISTSVGVEQATIKGINFSLKNGYKQKLNDIVVDLSVSVDTSSASETTTQGKIFAAYYNAAAIALKEFHNFYGISPTDIDKLKNPSHLQKGLVFYMTGKSNAKNEESSDFDIWDYWKNLDNSITPFGGGKTPQINVINDALNLNSGNDATINKIKNENFLSKLEGTESFTMSYDHQTMPGWNVLRSFTFLDETESGANGLVKGMQAKGSIPQWTTLEFRLSNDIFNVQLGGLGDRWGYFDGYGAKFTMIGRK